MPQLGQGRFGPIKLDVVLDGTGFGVVSFQSNGGVARITNGYVSVSTSTNQAVCRVYRGVRDTNHIINSTNSGSTGAAFSGTIDLLDGEILYVEWTGGDAGARATVTLVGHVIPFDQVTSSYQFVWDNPIAAGDGSLIFPAIKSPNFSTGVSGWRISRNGDVEFNNAVIRGTLNAGGGVVIVDSNGLFVSGTGGSSLYVWRNLGFYVSSVEGGKVQIDCLATPDGRPALFVRPVNSAVGGMTFDDGGLVGERLDELGTRTRPYFQLYSPGVNGKARASLYLYGVRSDDNAAYAQINTPLLLGPNGIDIGLGLMQSVEITSNSVAVNATETSIATTASLTFKANRAYLIKAMNKYTTSAATAITPNIKFRKTDAAGQQLGATHAPEFSTNGTQKSAYQETIFTVGAADVTGVICMTLTAAAAPTVLQQGAAGVPRGFQIYDIGPSSYYTQQTVLT